jgi:HEAT repeat protein
VDLEYFILFSLSVGATFLVVVASIALLVRKAQDVEKARIRKRLYTHYAAVLAELLLTALPVLPEGSRTSAIFQQYESLVQAVKNRLAALTVSRRRNHRDAIRGVLIDLAQDLTGETSDRLVYFFYSFGFVEEQIQLLLSKKWWIRAKAAHDLGLLRARKGIAPLMAALEDSSADVRTEAMKSLVTLAGVDSLRAILRVARRLSLWTEVELSVIIMNFKNDAVPYLLEALASPDQSVVLFCIEMLGQIGFVAAVEPLQALVQEYPSSVVKAKAAEALGRLGDERAEEVLVPLASRPEPNLRLKALEALGRIGAPSSISVLLRQFARGDALEKTVSARALAMAGLKGREALHSLALDPDEMNAAVASQVLEEFGLELSAEV